MEGLSIKGLNFSKEILVQSAIPKIEGLFAGYFMKSFKKAKLTKAIFTPKTVSVLKDINLSVEKGSILCISGKSGEGKSLLLRLIMGLEKVDSGKISLFGEPVSDNEWNSISMAEKGVGFVFQNDALISELNVYDNIATPLRYQKKGNEEEIEQKVNRALMLMLVNEFSKDYPYSLSLGMRKRVAVARAWALDSKILLLDEPTASLDLMSRNNFLSLMMNMCELYKTTVIMITQDLQIAKYLNCKVSFLKNYSLTTPDYLPEYV